ncbi:uncharacterized protein FA14DRAFT_162773 [Meira miltonrushii]|uniref:Secreted protein n=1 Tax=Meira miltonrushii TaxID=1280837 RepID=A0A316V1C3_9BASI|nr:uncharacterized protein FA14DRAFT_162773 [Meira miltonrushii]PWN31357.1 hypothetical protein FA14DRAFT_162773 [Meira miltonrushii]
MRPASLFDFVSRFLFVFCAFRDLLNGKSLCPSSTSLSFLSRIPSRMGHINKRLYGLHALRPVLAFYSEALRDFDVDSEFLL